MVVPAVCVQSLLMVTHDRSICYTRPGASTGELNMSVVDGWGLGVVGGVVS